MRIPRELPLSGLPTAQLRLVARLGEFIAAGKPVILTGGLAEKLAGRVKLDAPNVQVLDKVEPKRLLDLPPPQAARNLALKPFGRSFEAPNRVGLYLFADGSWVVENFNDGAVDVKLDGKPLAIPGRGWRYEWK